MTEAQVNTLEMFEDRARLQPEEKSSARLPENAARAPQSKAAGAGPWLFAVTLVAVIGFFWWLTIYSHGVAPHAS